MQIALDTELQEKQKVARDDPVLNNHPAVAYLRRAADWLRAHKGYLIFAILVYQLALLLYRINEPFGGFHSFNEGFYSKLAREALRHSPLRLFINPFDVNNPPLFTLLLMISFSLFGVSEAAARLVPILASLGTVYYIYLTGVRLFGFKAGILAAALTGVSPAFFLLSRNVQVDMVALLCMVGFIYHFILAFDERSRLHTAVAGIYFGLALLGKLPAGLVLIPVFIFETYRRRSLAWIFSLKTLAMAAIALLLISAWYGQQLLLNRDVFLASQNSLAATRTIPDSYFWKELLFREFLWAFSPPIFMLAAFSLPILMVKRSAGSVLVLSMLATYLTFYSFYHFHTYYILPIIPFAILGLAMALVWLLENRPAVLMIGAGLVLVSTFSATLLMSGQKYGHSEFADIRDGKVAPAKNVAVLYVDRYIKDNYGPLIEFYFPKTAIRPLDAAPRTGQRNSLEVRYVRDSALPDPSLYGIQNVRRNSYRPVVFGIAFSQQPENIHRFACGPVEAGIVGPPYQFGFDEIEVPSIFQVVDVEQRGLKKKLEQ